MEGREHPVVDYLIHPRWMGALGCALIAALLAHQVALFFAATILLLAFALSAVWGRFCLERLDFRRSFSAPKVRFGEELRVSLTISNRKLLPLAWLSLTDEIPAALPLVRGEPRWSWKGQRRLLPSVLSMGPYERVTRHYRFRCPARGEHTFGPVELRSGDLLGLATRTLALEARQSVLVYPRVVPLAALGLPTRFPLGDERAIDQHIRDPLRVVGVRPYMRGDSIRQMHWKATARVGTPQTKILEPSATPRVLICLNLATSNRAWEGVHPELLERMICVAASLATHLGERGLHYGLLANGLMPHTAGRAYVPPSRSPRQLESVLTLLARLTPFTTWPLSEVLHQEQGRITHGTTLVVITGLLDPALVEQLRLYRRLGRPVLVLWAGDSPRPAPAPDLSCLWVGDEARWGELGMLNPVPPTADGEDNQ